MIHISLLSKHKIQNTRDVRLHKSQQAWVKIISLGTGGGGGGASSGTKIMLSLKDVDQSTGRDLMPYHARVATTEDTTTSSY